MARVPCQAIRSGSTKPFVRVCARRSHENVAPGQTKKISATPQVSTGLREVMAGVVAKGEQAARATAALGGSAAEQASRLDSLEASLDTQRAVHAQLAEAQEASAQLAHPV